MSAIGTKRTCASALHMTAFRGKADMAQTSSAKPKPDFIGNSRTVAPRLSRPKFLYCVKRTPLTAGVTPQTQTRRNDLPGESI